MIYDNTLEVSGKKYRVVDQTGQYDYEWHIAALLEDEEGNLFYAEDSGCSCSYFGEALDASDLIPVKNWQEAVELAKASVEDYFLTDKEVFEFANRLRNG